MEVKVDPKYFDYAASAPPWPEAIDAFAEISRSAYGNPSSIHNAGKSARHKILELKRQFCDLLGFHDGRLLLTATGSEANNTIINGHLNRFPDAKILMAMDVHDSIWYAYKNSLKKVRLFTIDKTGHYDLKEFEKALDDKITLVCINHVCNETGAIQPVKEIAEICDQKGVRLMIDGMQAMGHLQLNLDEIPFSYYTLSGHKFGSVRGAAGVLVRDNQFDGLVKGGKQEWEKRAGTENIASLASMVAALKKSLSVMKEENEKLRRLKKIILDKVGELPNAMINSHDPGLPGLVSLSFPGFSGREIVGTLALSEIAVSTGSACHANEMEPSRIIRWMGRTSEEAIGSIRISMGVGTTEQAVNELLEKLFDLVN